MHVEHYPRSLGERLVENGHDDRHDEFHRGEVIVDEEDSVLIGLLEFLIGPGEYLALSSESIGMTRSTAKIPTGGPKNKWLASPAAFRCMLDPMSFPPSDPVRRPASRGQRHRPGRGLGGRHQRRPQRRGADRHGRPGRAAGRRGGAEGLRRGPGRHRGRGQSR